LSFRAQRGICFSQSVINNEKGASAQKPKRPFYLSSTRTLFSLNRPRPTLDCPRFEFRPINVTLFKRLGFLLFA